MAARAALYALLEADAGLQTLGVQAVYPQNSVDTPAEDLFIVIRWDPTTSVFGGKSATDRFSIWAHDREKDYGRITDVLNRVRELVPAQVHLRGDDNWILTAADWLGEGPDLYDAGYETLTRFADFRGVSRYDSPGA